MKNFLILTIIFSFVTSCTCSRKDKDESQNIQQKNVSAEGYVKNYDNSAAGLPRRLPDEEEEKSCLELGEEGRQEGEMPIKELKRKCCDGLVDKVSLEVCGKGVTGGYIYTCTNCGDGTCDSNYENKCNCPEDCKP